MIAPGTINWAEKSKQIYLPVNPRKMLVHWDNLKIVRHWGKRFGVLPAAIQLTNHLLAIQMNSNSSITCISSITVLECWPKVPRSWNSTFHAWSLGLRRMTNPENQHSCICTTRVQFAELAQLWQHMINRLSTQYLKSQTPSLQSWHIHEWSNVHSLVCALTRDSRRRHTLQNFYKTENSQDIVRCKLIIRAPSIIPISSWIEFTLNPTSGYAAMLCARNLKLHRIHSTHIEHHRYLTQSYAVCDTENNQSRFKTSTAQRVAWQEEFYTCNIAVQTIPIKFLL